MIGQVRGLFAITGGPRPGDSSTQSPLRFFELADVTVRHDFGYTFRPHPQLDPAYKTQTCRRKCLSEFKFNFAIRPHVNRLQDHV